MAEYQELAKHSSTPGRERQGMRGAQLVHRPTPTHRDRHALRKSPPPGWTVLPDAGCHSMHVCVTTRVWSPHHAVGHGSFGPKNRRVEKCGQSRIWTPTPIF